MRIERWIVVAGLVAGMAWGPAGLVAAPAVPTIEREDRTYHKVSIAGLARSRWTHVQVEGLAAYVRRQADGDVHIRIEDGAGAFVVAEVVPWRPVATVRKGDRIRVFGIARWDTGHGWAEVHPVEHLEILIPRPRARRK